MTRMLLLALLGALASTAALAQPVPADGPVRNTVDRLLAVGDTLWAGPRLVFTPDGGATWQRATGEDFNFDVFSPPQAPNASVYSLAERGGTLAIGLGFRDALQAASPQGAAGFALSRDGGQSWQYRFPHLDQPEDTLQVYGVSLLFALPTIAPQNSPPYDLAIDPISRDIWVAGGLAGARRLPYDPETDAYASRFRRVVLPPDTVTVLRPEEPQFFPFVRQIPGLTAFSTNFLAFSVLADETGTIWIGTEGGLNRSRPEDILLFQNSETGEIFEERAWQRFPFDGTLGGLTGSAVIALAEQPTEDARNPIWAAVWTPLATPAQPAETFGVVVTRDGGETFEPTLLGERVYGFGFCETGFTHCAPGTVWAAAEDGLFTSTDDGRTWIATRRFADRDRAGRFVRPGAGPRAVAVTRDALWVGTTDGLLRSTDGGQSWTIFRADVPVDLEDGPDVEVYAYPNPFSPRTNRVVRFRYESEASRIRIFDFSRALVRTLDAPPADEAAWDGLDDRGARVPNGVYFYAVDTPGGSRWGKLIVLE